MAGTQLAAPPDRHRVVYEDQRHQLRAVIYRLAPTGAWVQVHDFYVSYPQTQQMLARVEGIPGPEELGWVGDPEELGALGKRIKAAAKKVAKSKAFKVVAKVAKVAAPIAAIVPGGQAIAAAGLVGKIAKSAKQAKKGVAAAKSAVQAAKPAPKPQARVATTGAKINKALAAVRANGGRPSNVAEARAVEAQRALAAMPPEQRAAAAPAIEARLDAFKVLAPSGNTIFVPLNELQPGGASAGGEADEAEGEGE